MNNDKKTNETKDLLAAKEEAKEQAKKLTDEELDTVAGGGTRRPGDERNMNEALADIAGLTEGADGFC